MSINLEEKRRLYNSIIVGINVEYCNDIDDCWNSNVVRGTTIGLVKRGRKAIIVKYYSHTASDCEECSPEDIEQLDVESLEVLDEFEIPENVDEMQLIYNIFYHWFEKYFNA